MRRTIPFVVVAVVALLALPVVGIGQPTTIHGGTPGDVYMNSSTDVCNAKEVLTRPVKLMPTAITVGEQSHVLTYFTATLSRYRTPELVLTLELKGADSVQSSQEWIQRGSTGPHYAHSTVTVMWPFADVAPGDYTVRATARLGGPLDDNPGASLQACALTVFVVPPA